MLPSGASYPVGLYPTPASRSSLRTPARRRRAAAAAIATTSRKTFTLVSRKAPGMRIPALELEQVVVSLVVKMLENPIAASECNASLSAIVTQGAVPRSQKLAITLRSRRIDHHRPLVRSLVRQVIVGETSLTIHVDWAVLCSTLKIIPDAADEELITLETTARLTRSGRVLRMIQADNTLIKAAHDLTLIRLIVKARDWWQRLQQERGLTVSAIAEQEGVSHPYVTRILRLAFLSPRVVQAIIGCRQLVWMDGGALSATGAIALNWEVQKQHLCSDRRSNGLAWCSGIFKPYCRNRH